ncbi:MAG: Arc family DNA-binding protein [Thiothrix sp.]|nr:Arc family DNA-binding protein [Thiothrix sp.]HPQ95190.1 Arc family DNA-binding protein [Thiolinea sp.]
MAQERPYPLRLAPEFREQLEEIARQNGRSLNSEITLRLEASMTLPSPIGGEDVVFTPAQLDAIRELIRQELDGRE